MNKTADGAKPPTRVLQPLTFGGVAAFAEAPWGALMLSELAAALMLAVCFVWLIHLAYCPIILQAIQKMPETASLADGRIQGVPENLMSENRFLAIAVKPVRAGNIGQDADLQLELRRTDFCVAASFSPNWGLEVPYGKAASAVLARSSLEPWWSAWQPMLLAGAGAAGVVFCLVSWALLAVVYMAPARTIAWFANRSLTWRGAWRLASAAFLPGTLVLAGAMILYGCGVMDLVGFSFFAGVQIIIGWVYIIGGACKAPPLTAENSKRNPFTA